MECSVNRFEVASVKEPMRDDLRGEARPSSIADWRPPGQLVVSCTSVQRSTRACTAYAFPRWRSSARASVEGQAFGILPRNWALIARHIKKPIFAS